MKRLFITLFIAIISVAAAYSQKVQSKSRSIIEYKVEKPHIEHTYNWFIKAGAGYNSYHVKDLSWQHTAQRGGNTGVAYNVSLGFQKAFNLSDIYWGGQIGSTIVGYSAWPGSNAQDLNTCPSVYIMPNLGMKRNISNTIQLDGHIGAGFQYAFMGGDRYSYESKTRAVWEIGCGLWFSRFLVELDYIGSAPGPVNNNLVVNLGFRF